MWHLWAAKFGEYLIGTRHKNWLRERLSFRFYPVNSLEWTQAALTQRMPFIQELRTPLVIPAVKAMWNGSRIVTYVAATTQRSVTSPTPLDVTGFIWGVEDLVEHPVWNGFVALGAVVAERPDDFTATIPMQPDGQLISVEWGDVAFKRAGHVAVLNRLQLNKVEELHPGFNPMHVAEQIDRSPFAPSRSFSDVARNGVRKQPRNYGFGSHV